MHLVSSRAALLAIDQGPREPVLDDPAASASNNPIRVVESGERAIAYLSGDGEYADRQKHPLPKLMFLDLNLPGMDGFEVLKWLRGQLHLRHIRVVVLSSSPEVRLFSKACELGADFLFVKTHDNKDLVSFVQSFVGFAQLVQPPPAKGKSLALEV
jgi:CheY-like chemotaxis protein